MERETVVMHSIGEIKERWEPIERRQLWDSIRQGTQGLTVSADNCCSGFRSRTLWSTARSAQWELAAALIRRLTLEAGTASSWENFSWTWGWAERVNSTPLECLFCANVSFSARGAGLWLFTIIWQDKGLTTELVLPGFPSYTWARRSYKGSYLFLHYRQAILDFSPAPEI